MELRTVCVYCSSSTAGTRNAAVEQEIRVFGGELSRVSNRELWPDGVCGRATFNAAQPEMLDGGDVREQVHGFVDAVAFERVGNTCVRPSHVGDHGG